MKNLLKISAVLAITTGIIMIVGGFWAVLFTYQNVAREHIVTPDDASIPNTLVRGPFTLHSQAEIIHKHTLSRTDGLTYAEMPRQVPAVDKNGEPVLNGEGKPVMVSNEARDIWVVATTLITALRLGIITYLFSGLIILFGLISVWTGFVFSRLTASK